MMNKECVLYARLCQNCGECLQCDLDPNKQCDNCNRCIDEKENYRTLDLLKFFQPENDDEENIDEEDIGEEGRDEEDVDEE